MNSGMSFSTVVCCFLFPRPAEPGRGNKKQHQQADAPELALVCVLQDAAI